ncbi:hypothetical protein HBI88_251360 [Parastagonospora nodorum]|nr:hypothetical protein HBI97_167770 [Parastagonospora nodorum]KAH5781783.1 hypothetical protein HBI96_251830 [Parastagonospora nodorum]KAH5794772.1 hypothetical protein HBI94_252520 [Parastagonospora nodorum]KAH5827803.1 hypothetical protein HBI93_144140 [Parastagonospora nodorum]KAH5844926.1 hypothetical protein HBI90_251430 [Parastagonospora nodorum]
MCAKDDLIRRKMLFQTHNRQLAGEPATAESITAKEYEDIAKTSSLSRLKADQHFFVYQNILSLIAFIISHRPFADELPVYVTIRNLSREARRRRSTPSTLLARFIPTTKIRDPLLKSQVYHYCISKLLSPLENAAKSRILLACADRRTRQCYPTIYAILANYEEQVLLTSIKKNRHCTRYTKHHNFNIHVSLATDTLHLLLKGLVMKMLDFMQDILDDIYPSKQKAIIQQLIAIVSPLFVSKAPFALHFIRAVCDLVTLAQYKSHDEDTLAYIQGALERMNVFKEEFRVYRRTLEEEKNFNYPKALDSICTRANSEAHHITIVKQFYSMTNKKEYILQICLHNSRRTALLAADHATIVKQSRPSTTVDIQDRTYSTRSIPGIQPHSTKLPLSEVAANIAISDFTHAAAVFVRNKRQAAAGQLITSYDEDRLDVQEFKHRDNRRQSRTVTDGRVVAQLHLILTIIDHTRYDKDRKHIAYIRAFSEVLLFNNNRQINNTTRMLSVPFKFYDLSTIIRPVHLVPRDLPNSTTRTTMSYYVNNYID